MKKHKIVGDSLRIQTLADLGLEDKYYYSMRCFNKGLCFQGLGEVAIIDNNGALEASFSFDSPETYVVTGGDNALHSVYASETAIIIYTPV